MTCHELAQRLSELRRDLGPLEVARLTLLILSQCEDPERLSDDSELLSAWKHAAFRLEAATDQHAAVAQELDQLCAAGPLQFTPDQLWILLRAVKVQSQVLELYTDQPALA